MRVAQIKERSPNKSMIILLHTDNHLNRYVRNVPEVAWDLLDTATEPMTIIYPEAINLPKVAVAEDGSIGIRIVKEGPLFDLLKALNKPLISTSANISGNKPALQVEDVDPVISDQVDHVVTSDYVGTGKASTIIKLELNGEFEILRK